MTRIQMRRDTSTNWSVNNPTPANGEPCYETDTRKFKIGDGVTKYTNLPYQGSGGSGGRATNEYMGHLAMPSDKYIDLTLGASGTKYTAPADGWYYIEANVPTKGYKIRLENSNPTAYKSQVRATNANEFCCCPMLLIKKGDSAVVTYDGTLTNVRFIFIYAVGAEPIT